jgi:hypothetical protein
MTYAPNPTPPALQPTTRQAIFTVCTYSYLPKAQVLVQSLKGICDTYILLPERDRGDGWRATLERRMGCRILLLSDLALPHSAVMAFQYDAFELSNALKPSGFKALFAAGYNQVLYFDSDMEVYAPLQPIFEALSQGDAVVTAHIDAPLPDDGHSPSTEDVLRSGQFNGGFLALNDSPAALGFLDWWQDRLNNQSIAHPNHYYFVDQFYLAMIASFIERLVILRHPGVNAAYWNLPQREPFEALGDGGSLRGQPLIFFHYSGFAADDLPRISRHQNRYRLPDDHPILPLFARYRDRLAAAEAALSDLDLTYSFTHFNDGTPISMDDRRRLLLADPAAKAALSDPFSGLGALAETNPSPPWPVPRPEVDRLRALNAEAQDQAAQSEHALIAARAELEATRAELRATTAAYHSILASTAWKVTAPLRAALKFLR